MMCQEPPYTPIFRVQFWIQTSCIITDTEKDCQMNIFHLKNKELEITSKRLVDNFIDPHIRYLSFSGHLTLRTYQDIAGVFKYCFRFLLFFCFVFLYKDTSVESTLLMLHVLAYAFCKPITFYMILPTAFYGLLLCIYYDDKRRKKIDRYSSNRIFDMQYCMYMPSCHMTKHSLLLKQCE